MSGAPMSARTMGVREACRQRLPLDGSDAQALEHGLTQVEQERDEARASGRVLAGVIVKIEADAKKMREWRDEWAETARDHEANLAHWKDRAAKLEGALRLLREEVQDEGRCAALAPATEAKP